MSVGGVRNCSESGGEVRNCSEWVGVKASSD